jgi:formimidoylglutamate deiminase
MNMSPVPGPAPQPTCLWAPLAWLPEGWAQNVLLRIGSDGHWAEVSAGVALPPAGAQVLNAPLLPSLVNGHSHAFQRAFAGLAERRDSGQDDFWSWRDRMYRVALRISPEQLRAVAGQLFLELLEGGYTQVCEFHYLHTQADGQPYEDPLTLSWALTQAAQDVGMGLTLIPSLYERAGFTHPTLRDDQRRFTSSVASILHAQQSLAAQGGPLLNTGVSIHSLRAVSPESITALNAALEGFEGPIHVHASEQTAEVDECLQATGLRPMQWLAERGGLDARWHLVHATHSTPEEIEAVAKSGAGVVFCPGTEGNLGDGFCDLAGWMRAGVPFTLGSDSHISRCAFEELRWLEYVQRLRARQRNLAAHPEAGEPSTAQRLWREVQRGSPRPAGLKTWGLQAGARADALLIDRSHSALLGVPDTHLIDALVFNSPSPRWRDVMVAGQWRLRAGHHPLREQLAQAHEEAMRGLWG